MDLAQFVGGQVFAFLLIFVRVGSALLILPTFGEAFVPTQIRLLFALLLSLLLVPVIGPNLPPQPTIPGELVLLILGELLVGLFIGTIARMLMSALETAGFMISQQLGLSAAQSFNPALAAPGNPAGALMGVMALVLILATDLHHMLLLAVADSYTLFEPGRPMPLSDMSEHIVRVFAKSFEIGIQISMPFVVLALLFFLGLGLIARLVPQIQVFFVGLPLQILLGTLLFAGSLSALLLFWLRHFEDQLIQMLRP